MPLSLFHRSNRSFKSSYKFLRNFNQNQISTTFLHYFQRPFLVAFNLSHTTLIIMSSNDKADVVVDKATDNSDNADPKAEVKGVKRPLAVREHRFI